MNGRASGPDLTAARLRADFDRSFAAPPPSALDQRVDLLAIRVAGDPYAIPLTDVTGVFAGRPITRLSGPLPELLGVAGLRGRIVAVYALRVLLGYAHGELPRWLVLAGQHEPVGLAFDEFDGHVRVGQQDIMAAEHAGGSRVHVNRIVRDRNVMRRVIDLSSLVEEIRGRARHATSSKER